MATFDIIFSSGGTKGVAFAGALEVLERRGHTARRLLGTSAGAVTAALVAAGYSGKELAAESAVDASDHGAFATFLAPPAADELRSAVRKSDSETRQLLHRAAERAVDSALQKLMDKAPRLSVGLRAALAFVRNDLYDAAFDAFFEAAPDVPDRPKDERLPPRLEALAPLISFLEFGGFFSTDNFTAWLEKRIRQKQPKLTAETTLAQFHGWTGRDLSVVVADTTEKQALVLNHRTAPDCPLIQAVRMSMSVPLVWQEVPWQAGWGKYLGTPRTGHLLVDGGAMLNLPIRYVVQPDAPDVKRVMGDPPRGDALPLGLLIDEQLPVPGDVAPPEIKSKVVERLGRLIDTATRWEDELNRRYEADICRIPAFGYSALEFAASAERVQVMLNAGRCAMTDYLKARKVK